MTLSALSSGAPRPFLGLMMALAGALIITPDTLLIRLSGLEGWGLTFWRGLLIGISLIVLWVILEGPSKARAQIPALLAGPSLLIIGANFINALTFNFATMETSITVVVTALATAPLIAAALGVIVLSERLPVRSWAAIFFSMLGVLIVILNGEGALSAPPGNVWLGGGLGFAAAFGIAVVFVTTRRHPDVPVVPACAIGTLMSGFVGYLGAAPGAIMTGDPLMIGLMGLIVMPVSWALLSMAPRHTSPTNVSLFMLLEMVLGPFWVWLGTGERPSLAMMGGACLVLLTLAIHFWSSAREAQQEDG